jgi:hypothetical protein
MPEREGYERAAGTRGGTRPAIQRDDVVSLDVRFLRGLGWLVRALASVANGG